MLKNQKKKKKQLNSYIKFSSLFFQMAAIISFGAYLGKYLDHISGTNKPIFTASLSLLAITASMYYVFKEVNKNERK